jgi:hypothetical protein
VVKPFEGFRRSGVIRFRGFPESLPISRFSGLFFCGDPVGAVHWYFQLLLFARENRGHRRRLED